MSMPDQWTDGQVGMPQHALWGMDVTIHKNFQFSNSTLHNPPVPSVPVPPVPWLSRSHLPSTSPAPQPSTTFGVSAPTAPTSAPTVKIRHNRTGTAPTPAHRLSALTPGRRQPPISGLCPNFQPRAPAKIPKKLASVDKLLASGRACVICPPPPLYIYTEGDEQITGRTPQPGYPTRPALTAFFFFFFLHRPT